MNPKAKPTASPTASGSAIFRSGKSRAETGSSWPARDTSWLERLSRDPAFVSPAGRNLPEEAMLGILKLVILGTCLFGFVDRPTHRTKRRRPLDLGKEAWSPSTL